MNTLEKAISDVSTNSAAGDVLQCLLSRPRLVPPTRFELATSHLAGERSFLLSCGGNMWGLTV